jgi:hypothetical protein
MGQEQSQDMMSWSPNLTKEKLSDWFTIALIGHAACFWVFTRKHFGHRVFEHAGPAAVVIMFLYTFAAPCPLMIVFAAAWLALLIMHRVVTVVKRRRGWETHSCDDGIPWLVEAIIPPTPGDVVAKAICEPILLVMVGALLWLLSDTLGYFVMAGSLSVGGLRLIEHRIGEAEYIAMKDQEFEMRARLRRYRGRS